MTTTDTPTQQPQPEPCQTCQGNGEVVTDWERYLHPKPGDAGDEAVADCPDCDGQGLQDAQPQPSDAVSDQLGDGYDLARELAEVADETWAFLAVWSQTYAIERRETTHAA